LIARKRYPVGSKLFSTHRLHLRVRIGNHTMKNDNLR
jgi:hypothetical protein